MTRSMGSIRLAAVAAAALALLPASASAATVTLGEVAPAGTPFAACGICTYFQLQTDAGSPSYVIPGGGPWTITSWSTRGGTISSEMQLRVFRATGTPNQHQLVAESVMESVPANAASPFAANIPVQAGDLLGVQTGAGNTAAGSAGGFYPAGSANDVVGHVIGNPSVGDTVGGGGADPMVVAVGNQRINASATLTSAPATTPPATQPSPTQLTQPSNAFDFGRLQRNTKKGIAFLFVENLPGSGQIGLSGPGVQGIGLSSASQARKSLAVSGGTVKLKIQPAKKGKRARSIRRQLSDKGKAVVKVFVTYVPTGGTANTQARKIKLLRR